MMPHRSPGLRNRCQRRHTERSGQQIRTALRRPLTPIRTLGLIYWQALRLKLKGARYLPRPTPPTEEISQ